MNANLEKLNSCLFSKKRFCYYQDNKYSKSFPITSNKSMFTNRVQKEIFF